MRSLLRIALWIKTQIQRAIGLYLNLIQILTRTWQRMLNLLALLNLAEKAKVPQI